MKTTIFQIIIALLFIWVTFSCDSKLDIEPKQSVLTEEAIAGQEGVINVLNGAYQGLQGSFGTNEGGELYGGHFNFFNELLGDDGDLEFVGTFSTMRELYFKELTAENTIIRDSWIRAYDVINMCNVVLDNLDLVDEGERDRIEGEAKGIRGTLYMELARYWGLPYESGQVNDQPAVPLQLTPVYVAEDIVQLPRSTVEQVFTQAESDLLSSKQLLEPWEENRRRFSTYAASGILSRLYLQKGEFERAATETNRVIESENYSLAGTPLDAFNKSSDIPEYVFAIQQNANSNAGLSNNGTATFYASLNGSGRGDIWINESHLEKYEPGDLRSGLDATLAETSVISDVHEMFYVGVGAQNSGGIMTSKFGDGKLNIPIIRLAEMYLTRAEGNFQSGLQIGPNTPVEDINIVRERAGLNLLETVNQSEIRKERMLELAFEGVKLNDYKRWKLDIGNLSFDAPELVLPVPQREIDVFPGLGQNTGY